MENTCERFNKSNRLKLFGHEDAGKEKDDRLLSYYYKTQQYEDIVSDLELQIVIGEKGTGKSALLKISYLENQESETIPIWIRLDDLSELYCKILESSNLYELKTLWKRSISKLIAMKLAAEVGFSTKEDYEKALSWSYENGYNTRDFISRTTKLLNPLYKKVISSDESTYCNPERGVLERLIHNKKVRIYLDDFDLDWKGNSSDILRLKSLILALSDMSSDLDGLSVRMAIRTDVYEMLRNEEFSDKIESSVIKCKWDNNEIIKALCKRICAYFSLEFDETTSGESGDAQYHLIEYLNYIFEPRFGSKTRCWSNAPIYKVMFSLIRRKPRDMVKLCQGISEEAYKRKLIKINDDCFMSILENYSQERFKDLVNEYRNQLPQLQALLTRMSPTNDEIRSKSTERYVYTTAQLYSKIKNILNNVPIKIYQPSSNELENADMHTIAHFLYKIGFITGRKRKESGKIFRVYYDESPYLLKINIGDGGYAWEIHPAYRGAIAKGVNDIWEPTLDVNDEELELEPLGV